MSAEDAMKAASERAKKRRESWHEPVLFAVTYQHEIGDVRLGDGDEMTPFAAAMCLIGEHGQSGVYEFPSVLVDGTVTESIIRVTIQTIDV